MSNYIHRQRVRVHYRDLESANILSDPLPDTLIISIGE